MTRPEVHYSYVMVQAISEEDAIERVKQGEGHETNVDYAYTLDEGWDAVHSGNIK